MRTTDVEYVSETTSIVTEKTFSTRWKQARVTAQKLNFNFFVPRQQHQQQQQQQQQLQHNNCAVDLIQRIEKGRETLLCFINAQNDIQ